MPDIKQTKRTPLTEPMLIRKERTWQVCYQARGTINYERVTAWVYGPESTFFCLVGEQHEIIMLPQTDFKFGGEYSFMIDRVDKNNVPIERLGGAIDAGAATVAYEYLKPKYSSGLRLRNGARLMRSHEEDELEEKRKAARDVRE